MKLKLQPASQGALWVRQGIRAFWRQPFAMTALFFLLMLLISLVSAFPVVGSLAALALFPPLSLGLMAATREIEMARFPRPWILFTAFRHGKARTLDMLMIGGLYAVAFAALMLLASLLDEGQLARMYLAGDPIEVETLVKPEFQNALWLAMLLYLPVSAIFWHAPALVYWHGIPVGKSLFFSAIACLRNWKAYLTYFVVWTLIFSATILLLTTLSQLMGGSELISGAIVPALMMLMAMFFSSTFYTFVDSFDNTHYG